MSSVFNMLIIEDSSEFCENLRHCLLRLGCNVSIASTAGVGIEKLQSSQYDAVFASLCLCSPGCRGVARWIKQHKTMDTKVFLTTSWKGDLERDLLRADGIHDVIRKPFSFNEIRDKVLELLG